MCTLDKIVQGGSTNWAAASSTFSREREREREAI